MIKDTIVLILCIIIYFGCLIELIRIKMCKININDYFYCALNNKIYMKSSMISKKKWKSLKREENKERIFYGFDKLAENKIYKLITHKAMIYRLMACEELGYITIIKIKTVFVLIFFHTCLFNRLTSNSFSGDTQVNNCCNQYYCGY